MDSIFFKLYTLYYDFCVLSTDRGKSQRHMDLTLQVSLFSKTFCCWRQKNTKSIFFYLDLSLPMVKKATGCIYTSGKSGLHSACMQ